MSDERWVVFHELRAEGFPRLLWEAMTRLGYSDRPEYSFHEYEEFGVEFCAVRVQLFDCAEHPEWAPFARVASGARRDDARQTAAMLALQELCLRHTGAVGRTAMRYFPLADLGHEVSRARTRSVSGVSLTVDDATLAATVRYLTALDQAHRALQARYRALTERCVELAAREADLAGQLERLRVHTDQVEVRSAIVLRDWRTDESYLRRKINELLARVGPSQRFTARRTRVTIPWTGRRAMCYGVPPLDPEMDARVQTFEAQELARRDALGAAQVAARLAAAVESSADADSDPADPDPIFVVSDAESAVGDPSRRFAVSSEE